MLFSVLLKKFQKKTKKVNKNIIFFFIPLPVKVIIIGFCTPEDMILLTFL